MKGLIRSIQDEHARSIAPVEWLLGNELVRKIVVEIGNEHDNVDQENEAEGTAAGVMIGCSMCSR